MIYYVSFHGDYVNFYWCSLFMSADLSVSGHYVVTLRHPLMPVRLHEQLIQNYKAQRHTVFYPTVLKGCRGIVFTHGIRMGGRMGGWREKVCPGCISETVRCRNLILGRDIC